MPNKIGACTLSGTFTIEGSLSAADGIDEDHNYSAAKANFSAQIGGYNGSVDVTFLGLDPGRIDSNPPNVFASASAGGDTDSIEGQAAGTVSLTGVISISVPCDVVWEYVSTGSINPFFRGVVDSPGLLKRRYFLLGNGNASVSASGGGASASDTIDVRGVEILPYAYCSAGGGSAAGIGAGPADPDGIRLPIVSAEGGASGSISVDTNIPSGSVPSSTASYSGTNFEPVYGFSGTASASAGGASFSSTNYGYIGGLSATSVFHAARTYDVAGVLRAMESAYPDSLTLFCDGASATGSGSFSFGKTQVNYSTGATVGDQVDAHTLNTFADVQIILDRDSLEAVGDEPLASRVMFRGEVCPGLTITQAASYLIDDMGDLTGGKLTITGPATGTRAYPTEKSFSSYRHLKVKLRSVGSADKAAKININGYSWNLTTGADGAYVEPVIDLCSPDSVSGPALNDAWDTRHPIPTATSVTSGPYRVGAVTFDGIASDVVIEVDSLTLLRVNEPTLDILPTLYPSQYIIPPGDDPTVEPEWPLSQNETRSVGTDGEGTSDDFVRRFLLANSDGRQTVEEPDLWYTKTVAAVSGITTYSFNGGSLSSLAGEINSKSDVPFSYASFPLGTDPAGNEPRWPGWTATAALTAPAAFVPAYSGQPPPANPYFYNADAQQATFLFGAGAFYSGYSGGWTFGFDRPAGSVPSQPVFDIIEMCGMAGDVFGHGGGTIGGGGGLSLVAAAILRAQSHGLVLDAETGDSVDGQAVEFLQSSVVGTGTSRTDGWYHTSGVSAKPPGTSISVRPVGGSALGLGMAYTRHRHRGTFVYVPPSVGARSPRGLNTRQGGYYGSVVVTGTPKRGRIQWRRTEGEQVPRTDAWHVTAYVSAPAGTEADGEPWPWYDDRDGSLHVFYTRATFDSAVYEEGEEPTTTAVREAVSFDDGATWAESVTASDGARHGQAVVGAGANGGCLRAWFRPNAGYPDNPDPGVIVGTYQSAGDASPSAPFVFRYLEGLDTGDMVTDDDTFALTYSGDSGDRFRLFVMMGREPEPSGWSSADDGRTWTRDIPRLTPVIGGASAVLSGSDSPISDVILGRDTEDAP